MTASLQFSATALMPILLITLLGFLLNRFGVIKEEFFEFLHKLVFRAALPSLIFIQIYQMDLSLAPDADYLWFCMISMTICYGGGIVLSALFIRDRKKAGAMSQAMTRSTFSIVGLPLAAGLFGEAGSLLASLLLAPVVIFNNAFAVVMLSIFDPEKSHKNFWRTAGEILLGIVKNPLILGMVAAFLVKLCGIDLPEFLTVTVRDFSAIAQPLALLCLGAGFVKEGLRGRVRLAAIASIVKTVFLPLIFCTAAILCGFRGVELGLVCILFGGPTTISSYIMAKNMNSDEVLTGQVVLLSTVMSAFTLFLAFFLLHYLGFLV